jgi:hypothetical protein
MLKSMLAPQETHRLIRIWVNAEVDRNLVRKKIRQINGQLVQNTTVASCTLREWNFTCVDITQFYSNLSIVPYTERISALVPCL